MESYQYKEYPTSPCGEMCIRDSFKTLKVQMAGITRSMLGNLEPQLFQNITQEIGRDVYKRQVLRI